MAELLTSSQNPRIRHLLDLQQKSQLRRREGRFVVEGRREVERCVRHGYEIDTVFCCPAIDGTPWSGPGSVVQVSAALYERIAYRGGTEGIVAIVHSQPHTLAQLQLPADPLVVVLERVEKPGNLGAVLRSADAAGADAVLVCDPLTDLYNPNLIRSSTGTLFSVPVAVCSTAECIDYLRQQGLQILTAQLQDSRLYYDMDMRRGTAIVMGTESTGLTDAWRQAADAHIRIPMLGCADSLNVSVSAAILMYEARRQRQG